MSQTPSVSVIIPTHNRLRFTVEAIESVLQQTYPFYEIILIDDGSRFDLYFWLSHYFPHELASEKLRYFYQENLGVSAARNHGIRMARHPFVAFLDSDDLWKNTKLSLQIEVIQREKAMVLHSDEKWLLKGKHFNQKKKHQKPSGYIFNDCLEFCRVPPSSVLMSREVFERCGCFDETLPVCEDYDMWLRLSLRYPFYFIEKPLVIKRGGHRDQLSRSEWGLDRFRIQSLQKILREEELSPVEEESLRAMLREKLTYVINGARKRGNTEIVEQYSGYLKELEG